jgi:hypothetical protein
MKHHIYNFTDLFTHEIHEDFEYPFNLKFKRVHNSAINGPGIYIITLDDKIAYLGRYGTENDIMIDRWSKHIQTITNRGYNVGFNRSIERFNEIYSPIYLKNNLLINENELLNKRLNDTGVVTAENKVRYCMDNWDKFKDLDNSCNLNFHLFKPAAEHTEILINNIAEIETNLILKINPPANAQYVNKNQTLDLENAIKSIIEALDLN